MTIQPREHSSLAGWWQQPGGGTAAVPAAGRLLAPCSLSLGLPLVACPTVCCLPVADRPCTPSAGGPPGIDCSSPPAPVDTPAPPQRRPTSRFDALFMAAQQELGSVRPSPAPSASRTRLACGRTAARRTQGGSSSSGSSGSGGGTSGGRRTRASARSRLATSPGGCSKPQHSIPRAVQSQRLLPAQLQLQGILAVQSQAQSHSAAAVAVARLAAHLRRTQVLSGLVTALLQAPSAPAVSCRAQHMAAKLAPLLPAGQRPEEQRQLEEARRFLRLF